MNVKAGAWALIAGALSFIALMVVHPMHAGGAPIIGALSLSSIVHGTALVGQPVLLYGFWVLTRALGEKALAQIGFAFYALASMFTMLAASMSGLVLPVILEAAHGRGFMPGPVEPHTLQPLANLTIWLNRTFAGVHVGLFAMAMMLWSLAWPSRAVFAMIMRGVGLLVGLGVIGWALSGTMTLEAQHGALLVTLVQMAWTLMAAGALLASAKPAGGG